MHFFDPVLCICVQLKQHEREAGYQHQDTRQLFWAEICQARKFRSFISIVCLAALLYLLENLAGSVWERLSSR